MTGEERAKKFWKIRNKNFKANKLCSIIINHWS